MAWERSHMQVMDGRPWDYFHDGDLGLVKV